MIYPQSVNARWVIGYFSATYGCFNSFDGYGCVDFEKLFVLKENNPYKKELYVLNEKNDVKLFEQFRNAFGIGKDIV